MFDHICEKKDTTLAPQVEKDNITYLAINRKRLRSGQCSGTAE